MSSQKKINTTWKDGQSNTFTFDGKVEQLLADLSQENLDNILIEEPSLEELFMYYYQEDGK